MESVFRRILGPWLEQKVGQIWTLVLVPTVNTGETYHLRYDVKDTVSPKLRQRKAHHPLKLDIKL